MSSSAQVDPPKKSFLCCPAPFGNCCGGSKSRKTSPPNNVNDAKNGDKSPTRQNDVTDGIDDKKRDVTSNGGGSDDKKNPFLSDAETSDNEPSKPKSSDVTKPRPVTPRKAGTPMASPAKVGFLVSFLVDARGGAMKGNRGSGLRLIIPPGAVDSPVRVTCRYVRRADRLSYPPPLMEREALASRILEMGPPGAEFDTPVLIEVPHFASLRDGERELVVLRSDDGETWREHTLAYLESRWEGGDDEIYQDFVANTNLTAAYEELDTDRVVRISARKFPHYFAILSRVREEVRAIGSDGGKITTPHAPHLQVYFPSGALQKKIKVALQVQNVPETVLSYVWPDEDLRVSPLVALEPRRRRFHCPVQIMLYLPQFSQKKLTAKADNVRLLCSLTGSTSKAHWEDVTDDTPFCVKNNCVIFETRVSALFWAVAVDRKKGESDGQTSDDDYEQFGGGEIQTKKKDVLELSTYLYDELVLPPYMAKIVVLYRPMTPHAWCDCLRVLCVTDDKAESAWNESKFGSSTEWEWKLVAMSEEMEISASNQLNLQLEKVGNIEIAGDCQLEFGYRQSLIFEPFQENSANLLIRAKNKKLPKNGKLTVKKSFKHVHPSKQLALCTLELDLGGGLGPGSAELLAPSPAPTNTTSYSIPDLEVLSVVHPQLPDHASLVSHVTQWFPPQDGAITSDDEIKGVLRVKEYSSPSKESNGDNNLEVVDHDAVAGVVDADRAVPQKTVWY